MTLKDKKHWSHKSEAAQDEVKDAIEETVDWLWVRRREAGYAAGGVAAAALVLGFFLYQRRAAVNAAWDKLSQAELYAYSGRPQDARELVNQVTDGSSPAAAALAQMLDGDLHFPKGEYDQALTAYDKAAAVAPEALRPFAQAEKVMTLAAAGKAADCATSAQAFLDAYPEHLLAAQIHTDLARCQMALGQNDVAKATLQRIALQYPGTPWAEWAADRLTPAPAAK
ncbi:MAG: tetratricopeptide repeat protein [Elusimicrobia bacterium]|nr:tetratricopeptide repeat protein [Elusimicrobiota bacterium]MDE2512012.1 tetratricopeptide repeat protein [Elusimicrobiota bacterium]